MSCCGLRNETLGRYYRWDFCKGNENSRWDARILSSSDDSYSALEIRVFGDRGHRCQPLKFEGNQAVFGMRSYNVYPSDYLALLLCLVVLLFSSQRLYKPHPLSSRLWEDIN